MAVTAKQVKELREISGAGMMDCKKVLVEVDGNIDEAAKLLREKGLAKAAKKADRVAAMGLVRTAFSPDGKKAAMVEVNSETDFVAKNQDFIDFVESLANVALNSDAKTMEEFMALDLNGESVETTLNSKIAIIGENMNIRRFERLENPGEVYTGYIHGNGTIGVIVGVETEASKDEIAVLGKDVAMQVASMNPQFLDQTSVDQNYISTEKEILRQEIINSGKPEAMADKIVEGKIKKMLKDICLVDQKFVKDSDLTVSEYVEKTAKEIGKDMKVTSMARYEVGEGIDKKEEDFAAEVAAAQRNK